MSNVTFDTSCLDQIALELNNIPDEFDNIAKEALDEVGNVLKDEVKRLLPRSDVSRPGYKHMQDDVKVHQKKDKLGIRTLIVCGGKDTAYKWHMVDDGTNGNRGMHFTQNAISNSQKRIDQIVDKAVERVAKHDGK